MTASTARRQRERPSFDELAALWPRLNDALARDRTSDGPATGAGRSSSTGAGPATVNVDVLDARQRIGKGLQEIADQIVPLLRFDPRCVRTVEQMLTALPAWYDALAAHDQPLAEHIATDVAKWLGAARFALRLRAPRERIGRLCPHHRDQPAELVRDSDEAQLAPGVLNGRGQRRAADGKIIEAGLTWRRGTGVSCPHCREKWSGTTQLRTLMAMIDQADNTDGSAAASTTSEAAVDVALDGPAIALAIGVHNDTLRNWASRGKLERRGRDDRGRSLYSLEQARQLAAQRTTAPDPT